MRKVKAVNEINRNNVCYLAQTLHHGIQVPYMSAPIILWNPTPIRESDDAGNNIIKTTLAPPTKSIPQYTAYDPEKPRRFRRVPRLASFCIRALSRYPEQLHQLGSTRLYFDRKKGGTNSVLRAVLPKWRSPNFSLLDIDPRLWATIIQIYKDPPDELDFYPCQLSDPHVPLLNQIPMSPDFTLLTLLCLANSRQLTDDNILSLKVLHNLAALDVSNCMSITAHGIRLLSRTLTFNEFGEKRGPWALRVLRMRACWTVDSSIFDCLQKFPLLTAVDLSDTRCRAENVKEPFKLVNSDYDSVFCYHLADAICDLLENHENMFPNETPYILSLQDEPLSSVVKRSDQSSSRPGMTLVTSQHESYVVLPPLRDGSSIGRSTNESLYFGNVRTDEFREKEARKKAFEDSWKRRTDSEDFDWEAEDSGWEGCLICNGEEECYCNDLGYCDESSGSEDEGFASPSRESEDEDENLRRALQASLAQYEEGVETSVPLTEALLGSQARGVERRRGPTAAVSANTFYQPRPPMLQTSLPWSSRISNPLTLFRVPPAWSRLDAITPQSQAAVSRTVSDNSKARPNEANASVKRKRELSMHALRSQLVKRHRPLSTPRNQTITLRPSPPPSPTSTLCNINDSPERQRPTLRPISNLQPPPRSAFDHAPRLKLDPTLKATRNPSSKPAARFSAVAARGTSKPRNMNLLEGFENQTRKHPRSAAIGAATSEDSGETSKFQKKPFSKSDGKTRPSSKGEEAKGTPVARQKGFDWNTWTKGQ
ncbi:uncharacterized protein FOMMEDRAFT_166135 [Fomitiporia mediterranea MF3/22]|uniref:uncharacterized protein n=1 Tax=Fomitiporia mediterranea (strain MF3/22) TaxID=694068 RepID=UPI0004409469|nr:uncharacterized protein FOMMEDRAFT_166135 [Fomitiporia mediterranea MF3/22]EJD05803.1 hypothetical protein FOMMEDRAFT_166135 [Fomitiporia mediterranea MF3/22]